MMAAALPCKLNCMDMKTKALEWQSISEQKFRNPHKSADLPLSSTIRLYCRLRNLTESALRLVGCTTGREFPPCAEDFIQLASLYYDC